MTKLRKKEIESLFNFFSGFSFKLTQYAKLIRLDKPIGILLLLWPTLTALWIAASGMPPLGVLLTFLFGTILMRSAGCAINDFADLQFDFQVKRTKYRPLVIGTVSEKESLIIAVVLIFFCFFLIRVFNFLSWTIALLAVLLAFSYPYMKRFFPVPQLYLGLAFSFGILLAFAVVQDNLPWVSWGLFIANIFWTVAYDTEYALVDREDDLKICIKSLAITCGRWDILIVMLCYSFFLFIYAFLAFTFSWSIGFWLAWLWVLANIVYHFFLIRERTPTGCFIAFNHNKWIGFVLFLGVASNYLD